MFRIASTTTQTRTPQLPHTSRNTNPNMPKSSGVIHTTSVSRPQLKLYNSSYSLLTLDAQSNDVWIQQFKPRSSMYKRRLVPQGQKASDYDNSDPVPPRRNVVPSAEK
ncbi:hypothetical protein Tco_1140837, partial [Tanacetum coccineum]